MEMKFYKNTGIADERKRKSYREVVKAYILHSCESWSWINKEMVVALHGWESRNLDLMSSTSWTQRGLSLEWITMEKSGSGTDRMVSGILTHGNLEWRTVLCKCKDSGSEEPKSDEKEEGRGCSQKLGQSDGEMDWLSEMVGVIEGMGKPRRDSLRSMQKGI